MDNRHLTESSHATLLPGDEGCVGNVSLDEDLIALAEAPSANPPSCRPSANPLHPPPGRVGRTTRPGRACDGGPRACDVGPRACDGGSYRRYPSPRFARPSQREGELMGGEVSEDWRMVICEFRYDC